MSSFEDIKPSHVDGRVKRMQVFLKRIGKYRKSSNSDAYSESSMSSKDDENIKRYSFDQEIKDDSYENYLSQYEKDVKSALTYYNVILNKGFIQKLPGTATAVLESVINAEETIDRCLNILFKRQEFQSEASHVAPLLEDLNRSITDLIRISDNVLFDSYLHVNIDKHAAFNATSKVSMSLSSLYDFVIPRIRKCSLNEELLQFSVSQHSSNNSLDALDNIPETDILDSESVKSDSWKTNDSGICSDVSSSVDAAPPKPPLPNSNRQFYGNFNNQVIRKALSHPGDIAGNNGPGNCSESLLLPPKKTRPISDHTPSRLKQQYPCLNSMNTSRSSISTGSSVSLNTSPSKSSEMNKSAYEDDSSIKRRMDSISDAKQDDVFSDDVNISSETFSNIQKYSHRYELLAKSTLSLFNDDDDTDDLLGGNSQADEEPPLLPKKKMKHFNHNNYLAFVEGYQESDFKRRPSSFYDNLPVPNAHNMTNDFFSKDAEEDAPTLPPKLGTYKNQIDSNISPFKSSKVIRRHRNSKRDSSGIYNEDNVPALDCKDVKHLLLFKKEDNSNLLIGGTVDALIVFASESEKDSLYYKAFLATYPTFIKPHTLICKLLYRANRFRDKNNIDVSNSVLLLLIKVMDEMFEELDKSLFDQLRSQVHRLLNLGELKLGKNLRDKIVHYCIKLQVNHMPMYQPKKNTCNLFEFKSIDLAQQMCVLDADYFIQIELPEILRWGKEQSETLSPNLSRFINHFNSMSFWIRTLILKESRQQEREKMYKKFLKIMRLLKKLNNFSSFLAILSALDSTPVRRLEWPRQYVELLAEDCKLIDSASAFKAYRQALSEAKPPCIPYLGLILQDITFIHLGNPQDLPDGKVNFVKRWQQYNILDSVRRFKENLYDFERDEKILDFFNEYEDHVDEDEMWEMSQKIKPRGK